MHKSSVQPNGERGLQLLLLALRLGADKQDAFFQSQVSSVPSTGVSCMHGKTLGSIQPGGREGGQRSLGRPGGIGAR